jgi:glycosyltransferase involved in cell wall biosynthesis
MRLNILYLSQAEIDDRSYGGAVRSNDLRHALQQVGSVDTLVLHGAMRFGLDAQWSAERVKRATLAATIPTPAWWRERRVVREWVRTCLGERHYDVVVARYVGLASFVPGETRERVVVDADDLRKSAAAPCPLWSPAHWKLAVRNAAATRLLRRVRHVWVVNPYDEPRVLGASVSRLPNVVRIPAKMGSGADVVPGRILMVGWFSHRPNAEGLLWFDRAVLGALARRIGSVELHAIGRDSEGLTSQVSARVRLRGFVPDLAAEYARAALVVAPISSGGGTPIKVLEALAHGRPLLASPFAQRGFDPHLRDREHLLVGADTADWIERAVWALDSREPALAMAARGRLAVQQEYGFERMLSEVRRTLLGSETAAPLESSSVAMG